MIQQQKSGRSLPAELRHIVSAYGALKPLKGFGATVLRESLYASGYLAVAPLLREALQQQPAVADLPGGPLVVSGVAAGLLATVCTQPADTIKTRMQVGWLCVAVAEERASAFTPLLQCCPAGVPGDQHAPGVPQPPVHHAAHPAHRGHGHVLLGAGPARFPHRLRRWDAPPPWLRRGALACHSLDRLPPPAAPAVFILNGTRTTFVDLLQRGRVAEA